MYKLFFLVTVFFQFSCASTSKINSINKFCNGTWIPIHQEFSGTVLPKAVFEKQVLIIKDSLYSLQAESLDKGVLKFNKEKLDIYGKDGVNNGKHFTCIYKLENSQLTICYNLKGDSYPDAFITKDKPNYFLSIFKKE